jgi:predicted RNase H-like HicB family nuclease
MKGTVKIHHYPLDIFWSDEDGGFIAEVPDLPGCCAFGKTPEEAAREAQDAIASAVEAMRKARRPIPIPSIVEPTESYSGKFVVRVPRSLHARLARRARTEGVSLNQYVAHILSR